MKRNLLPFISVLTLCAGLTMLSGLSADALKGKARRQEKNVKGLSPLETQVMGQNQWLRGGHDD